MKSLPSPARIAISLCMLAVAAAGASGLTGCLGGFGGCGVGAVPAESDGGAGASVSATGVVTFETIRAGSSEHYPVTVRDSADTDETIVGATLMGSGAGAFAVLTTFPVYVPAGQGVPVDVEFAPTSTGSFDAQLVLQTAKMGPSPVPLVGSSEIDGADAGAD